MTAIIVLHYLCVQPNAINAHLVNSKVHTSIHAEIALCFGSTFPPDVLCLGETKTVGGFV